MAKSSLAFRMRANFFVGEFWWMVHPSAPAANQIVNASKLQLGELFTREKLDRGLGNIGQLMEQNGYYLSRVSDEEKDHPETQQIDILFHIEPGPHAKVGRITVTGPAGYSVGQIQDIAKMHSGDYVSVQRVSRALDRLRKKYQKQTASCPRSRSQAAPIDRKATRWTTLSKSSLVRRSRSMLKASRSATPSSREMSRSTKKMRWTMTC